MVKSNGGMGTKQSCVERVHRWIALDKAVATSKIYLTVFSRSQGVTLKTVQREIADLRELDLDIPDWISKEDAGPGTFLHHRYTYEDGQRPLFTCNRFTCNRAMPLRERRGDDDGCKKPSSTGWKRRTRWKPSPESADSIRR